MNRAVADSRRHLDASLRTVSDVLPTSDTAQSVRLRLDVLGQSPGALRVGVGAQAPSGWTVKTSKPFSLTSHRLPVQQTASVDVSVPAGTAPGPYTVRITATAKGVKSVEHVAAIEVRDAARCAADIDEQCAVGLGKEVDHDGTATVTASDEGDFDGAGWSYDGDLLPAAGPVVWSGVTYDAPDPSGTAANFVEARGQSMLLPAGSYSSLRLVAAAHHGPVTTTLTVRYTDGTTAELPVTVGDWAGSAPQGSSVALEMPHRIKRGQGVAGPPVRLFGSSADLDASKTVRAVGLQDDPRVQVYAITLR
ncbi:NEW3 domain-containing protein [Streptomyces sp. ALI-76-A]|uniref:NEW3 domain-containing protein n=1 Tax=Streptomyces sp. ALI-76-A TaxID=3025736 RepID=UPI00256EC902|nr:NEW3 domain-containing protein [Streptomyces sp. ALI-76-A]MDL5206506.1 NEW3 domain-containing protein [Streptomyces sp. ALI-76-A]